MRGPSRTFAQDRPPRSSCTTSWPPLTPGGARVTARHSAPARGSRRIDNARGREWGKTKTGQGATPQQQRNEDICQPPSRAGKGPAGRSRALARPRCRPAETSGSSKTSEDERKTTPMNVSIAVSVSNSSDLARAEDGLISRPTSQPSPSFADGRVPRSGSPLSRASERSTSRKGAPP